ncbi:unnamed protein product [Arabidopsis halleri]
MVVDTTCDCLMNMAKSIKSCLRKVKSFRLDTPLEHRKCIICQDEYEAKDQIKNLFTRNYSYTCLFGLCTGMLTGRRNT